MHWLLVLAIALLVFGPKKLPEIGRGLGSAIRGFKDALAEGGRSAGSSGTASSADPAAKPENPSARV